MNLDFRCISFISVYIIIASHANLEAMKKRGEEFIYTRRINKLIIYNLD